MPWIGVAPHAPYFVTEHGQPWTPIGQNDAVDWPELNPLFRRVAPEKVDRHLATLADYGVTCLRLMLEYAHKRHRWFEPRVGVWAPNMVRFWDDLFALLEKHRLRVLLTPMDTYFQWVNWHRHPYNAKNGGPCSSRTRLMTCPATRAAIKGRIEFATRRWGGSGALFAWDLWNEMHPAQGEGRPDAFRDYIADVSPWLRSLETRLHGRAHPQTVSVFDPELVKRPALKEPIFRSPELDFANTHLYEEGTIDHPADTVAPALAAGRVLAGAIAEAPCGRPVFDSEHGPIHTFKDHKRTLPAAFDDEYFRHIQWAHLATGGAGGGMRWPNRHPHQLTPGMRAEQARLAAFLPLVDWTRFDRRCLTGALDGGPGLAAFGCASADQAVLYWLRTDTLRADGTLDPAAPPTAARAALPAMSPGRYDLAFFDPRTALVRRGTRAHAGGDLLVAAPVATDLALAVRRA